ncbi:MAG: hypothetical protein CMA84_00650 [Euryarchaeota archaeon]|jgi:hypothetical protein|nr:hypothetical protein [Euryarchaeota archaeon]MBR59711.1 hypothetical protein [Euryarchaeota archaeon]|tara:strand:- start:229 stop:633 length:405 start_codon:yes stop_codon:yes gene_type:complete
MLTLFWLFFMSASFLIRIHVPDAQSIASDYVLETSGEDAMRYALGLNAFDENYTSRMHELLDTGELDLACELVQSAVKPGMESNCWLSRNAQSIQPYGEVAEPLTGTTTVHRFVAVNGNVWTLSLDVWSRGGVS